MPEVFYIGSIFFALLTVYLLIFKENALRSYSDILLASFFILEVWCVISYLAIYYGWIINVPHIYKTTAPLNYLFPPLTYLYVRAVLFNEKKMSARDIWHLIPFILFFINYVPFYILPISEKNIIVQAAIKDINTTYKYKAGIFPESLSYILRIPQTLVYIIFQWKLIIRFKKGNFNIVIDQQIKDVLKWLKLFTWASTLFVIASVLLPVLVFFCKSIFISSLIHLVYGFLVSASYLVISSYLLIHPIVLLGFPFLKYKEIESGTIHNQSDKLAFITEDWLKEIEMVKQYFIEKKPFLIKGINVSDVAVGTGIPAKELSFIINQYFKQRFNDFINEHRIIYITKKLNEEYLNNYTIDTLFKKAGFSSKSTFHAAFKKIHNCTPSQYIESKKANML